MQQTEDQRRPSPSPIALTSWLILFITYPCTTITVLIVIPWSSYHPHEASASASDSFYCHCLNCWHHPLPPCPSLSHHPKNFVSPSRRPKMNPPTSRKFSFVYFILFCVVFFVMAWVSLISFDFGWNHCWFWFFTVIVCIVRMDEWIDGWMDGYMRRMWKYPCL